MNFQRTGSVSQTRTQNDLYRATGGTVRKAFLESIRFVISFRSANLSEKSIICCLWLGLEYLCWQNVWQISQAFDVGVYIKLLCYMSKNSLTNVFLFHSRPSFFPREFRHWYQVYSIASASITSIDYINDWILLQTELNSRAYPAWMHPTGINIALNSGRVAVCTLSFDCLFYLTADNSERLRCKKKDLDF